ncbi:FlaD/FlaE family flagellar protein [Halobellus limi]|uniref:Flagella accessory protein C (FlaC) n=1 Tax=Halobellus limi TaxID=699433 RepID=A0A1H5ZA69_9EURY|nr:FlaD/FlaE family flagellar protein [Halobellus limi]QCC48192.1 flagellar protein E [Halobellus limi]SEG32246.1 Flagella accessory protein C (FlaC) [Halobellus limi]
MGVMDWMDGDGGDESDPVATDGLGFDEDLDGEMGDLDGEMDDLDGEMGGMDDFGDDMGGFDDGGDFGGGDVDPDTIADMEDRISELENQVSSISSEMNTVREENKQIGETVEELDETIRKLLDIYEMVTRGINPFVDDAREMGGLEGDGAFGLFEMEEETEDDLDSEVASADAESFFDEDFGDLDDEQNEAELAAEDELAEEEHEDPAMELDDGGDGEEEAASGGASFDDLKAEYEENEGWDDVEGEGAEGDVDEEADLDEEEDVDGEADVAGGADLDDAEERPGEEPTGESVDAFDEAAGEADTDEALFDADEAGETDGTADRTAASEGSRGADRAVGAPGTSTGAEDAYLSALPARYTAESVVLEWTRFLVETGGAIGAARALRQYRSQGWITREVERTMSEHVRNAATAGETEQPQDLRVEHHKESLTYISRLAGDVAERGSAGGRTQSGHVDEARLLEELSALGGGARGIRR